MFKKMKAGGNLRVRFRTLRSRVLTAPIELTLLILLAGCIGSGVAQTIRAIPTYHNVGVHVTFSTAVPEGTSVSMAIKEGDAADEYREIHPLSAYIPVTSLRGVPWDSSPIPSMSFARPRPFLSNRLVTVRTRSEHLPEPTNGIYHVAPDGDDRRDGRSPATAFRTLRHALEVVLAGERVLLHAGRYHEGDIEVYPGSSGESAATPTQPIVIESAPSEPAIRTWK